MFQLQRIGEGFFIALDSMRSNKLRSALTILGVVIGVSTVMAMASLVQGLKSQILTTLETAGPTAFYVVRFFSQTPLNPDDLPYEVRIRPVIRESDAEAIRQIPEIQYAGVWIQIFQRIEYQGVRTQALTVWAADDHYMEIQGGALLRGRFFSRSELSGEPVTVLEEEIANKLFGQVDPIGKLLRIGGVALRVIGIYQRPDNIFEPPGQQTGAIVPYHMARHNFQYDETNGLFISVKGWPSVPVDRAQDLVTVAVRKERKLRPGMPNTFDLITQDQILDTINSLTGAFFGVMVALSSVALLVGGIGVMAIMMVSVTDRTREILVGLGGGQILKTVIGLKSGVPLWSAVLACAVSIGIGLAFGLYPANRASRMDPVEALRHE
jgi:putative ABC transport system permease protein